MKHLAIITLLACVLSTAEAIAITLPVAESDTVMVEVRGTDSDARFVPAVVAIQPGDVIRFVVREGLHTVTAYHPDNRRPRRIPETARAFDSGLLKTGESWQLSIEDEGVYDYFCMPHERMGHVGRILSGAVDKIPDYPSIRIPEAARKKLDSETDILLTKQHK